MSIAELNNILQCKNSNSSSDSLYKLSLYCYNTIYLIYLYTINLLLDSEVLHYTKVLDILSFPLDRCSYTFQTHGVLFKDGDGVHQFEQTNILVELLVEIYNKIVPFRTACCGLASIFGRLALSALFFVDHYLDVPSCFITFHVARCLFRSGACPILYFFKVKQERWPAEEHRVCFYFG